MRVFVADVAYHRSDHFEIVRKFAVFHVAANEVAEHPAEVLVARERKERTRIGQHADET